MEHEILPTDNQFQVYASVGDFRLCSVGYLGCNEDEDNMELQLRHKPPSEGLAIEYKYNQSNYLVIAFIDTNKDGAYDGYRSVGTRIEKFCHTWAQVQYFRALLNIAQLYLDISTSPDTEQDNHNVEGDNYEFI